MKKVISFSLWGKEPIYNVGALRNAKMALTMYPDFEYWFYIHRETVPKETVDELQKIPQVKIIFKEGDLKKNKPMMWRFEPIDEEDVEVFLSRDTDTQILLREKLAVEEWLQSNTLFHIMRDHPCHRNRILGGMFGTKKNPRIPSWKKLMDDYEQKGVYQYDQDFLSDIIYPQIIDNCTIHSSFCQYEKTAKPFPIQYDDSFCFVGEHVYSNESRNLEHINILRNAVLFGKQWGVPNT